MIKKVYTVVPWVVKEEGNTVDLYAIVDSEMYDNLPAFEKYRAVVATGFDENILTARAYKLNKRLDNTVQLSKEIMDMLEEMLSYSEKEAKEKLKAHPFYTVVKEMSAVSSDPAIQQAFEEAEKDIMNSSIVTHTMFLEELIKHAYRNNIKAKQAKGGLQ